MAAQAVIKQQTTVASPLAMATIQQPGRLPAVGQNLLEFGMAPSSRTSCRAPEDPADHPECPLLTALAMGQRASGLTAPAQAAEDRRERPRARQCEAAEAGAAGGGARQTFRGAVARDGEAGGDPATARCGFEASAKGVQGWHVEAAEGPATGPSEWPDSRPG